MDTKILIVAVILNDKGEILMRKKPDGSPPYRETWYIFGAEFVPNEPVEITLQAHVKKQINAVIEVSSQIGWDSEVKVDLDGVTKQFVYLDVMCSYVSGDLVLGDGIEKLEWVAPNLLGTYDIVPPSRKLFVTLGYTL